MIVFVDMIKAPKEWARELRTMGFAWSKSEPQPIADQVKLDGFFFDTCRVCELPDWARIGGR